MAATCHVSVTVTITSSHSIMYIKKKPGNFERSITSAETLQLTIHLPYKRVDLTRNGLTIKYNFFI